MALGTAVARDADEAQLCDIWQGVLGLPTVAIHDDFFALGGTSFTAVHVIAEIERWWGVELSLEDLFNAPTVAALAGLIRSGERRPDRGCLVRLRTGDAGSGHPTGAALPPLYLFHPLPGTVLTYGGLARALFGARPVWGVQSVGLERSEPPLDTIEAMAERYLDELRGIHPGGPWLLAGYSMGGLLAFEAARQLSSAGAEVGLVGLLDTYAPARGGPPAATVMRRNAIRTMARHVLGLDVDVDWLTGLDPDRQVAELLARGVAAGSLPPDYDADRIRRLIDVRMRNRVAEATYRPGPWSGRLDLFRAVDPADEDPDPDRHYRGWAQLAGTLNRHDQAGHHLQLLSPGMVQTLARALDAALAGS